MAAGSRRHKRQDEAPDYRDSDLQADVRDLDFDNINIPEQDVGPGPVTRSRMQTAAEAQTEAVTQQVNREQVQQSDSESASDKLFPIDTNPIIHMESVSPGPNAITALRKHVPATLLAKLPPLSELEFSRHSQPVAIANIRLLLGTFTDKSPTTWGNPVYAYLRPNPNLSRGPQFMMEGDEEYARGHNTLKIKWDDGLLKKRIALIRPFKQATTYGELYAGVKYYFLLAVEARVEDFRHDFIPVNETLVQQLTSLCQHYDPDQSTSESSDWGYSDESKTSANRPKKRDHRRPPGYAERPGVARVRSDQKGTDETSDLDSAENGNEGNDLGLHPREDNANESRKSQPHTDSDDTNTADSSSNDDEGDDHVQTAFKYHVRDNSSPLSSHFQCYPDASRRPSVPSANMLLALEVLSEEVAMYKDDVADKSQLADRLGSSEDHQFAISGIDRASRGLMPQDVVEKERDRVSTYDFHPFHRGSSEIGSSVLHQHLSETKQEHTKMTGRALSEPMPVKYHHTGHWERLRGSTSSSQRALKGRKEYRVSKQALQSPNPFVKRRPSSTYNDLISPALLREQSRVITGRIEKEFQAIKSGIDRMKRLQSLYASIGAESAGSAEKESRENSEKDTGDSGNPPSPSAST